MDRPQRKILRSPSLKRKNKPQPINQKVSLERVLGLTASTNASLACDPNTGLIAYPAGCVVVLYNARKNKQTHILNTSKKTITALAFSGDGKHLVTGECGHQPAVRVWDVEEKTQVAEFHGHKFGISCVTFSPNLRYIVSVGTQHDMMVNVWNWKTGNKVASNKVSCKVSSVAFSHDGSHFITVGNRHVKFWYLESSKSRINETVPLQGRSGILGDQKNNFFCAVLCGQGQMTGSTFCITQSGLLCEFNEKRLLVKWVELRTKCATSISGGEDHIFIGCAEGVVRVFSAKSLHFVTTLPHPHYLGVDISSATSPNQMKFPKEDARYPDTIAIAFDEDHKKVTCIYNDHSLYQWDVHNIQKVGKAFSVLYHSSCVWSLEVYPVIDEHAKPALPPGSFLTGSSDDTVRVWNLDSHMKDSTTYKRNIYSHDLLKVIYTDPAHTNLCNVQYNPAGGADKTDTQYDVKNGIRSLRVSPDGLNLATGDKLGNLRIYETEFMDEIRSIEAHEADVLCLEYSYSKHAPKILASASRDRLIHVFDVEQNYGLLQTLDDHSASIQSVRFTDQNNQLKMLSCGADKSLLFRNAIQSPDFQFALDQHLVSKATLYDMIIDPTEKFVATACQDRHVRIYNVRTAKQKKNYKGSLTDDGVLLRIQLDPSGCYAATSCTDKNICLLDFYSGELMATMYGHSETITGLKFMNDLKHMISVSADGCIFVWRLPLEMTKQMKNRMEELGKMPRDDHFVGDLKKDATFIQRGSGLDPLELDLNSYPVIQENQFRAAHAVMDKLDVDVAAQTATKEEANSPDYRFSVGLESLPNWAKAKIGEGGSDGSDRNLEPTKQPKGRWAERADTGFTVKTQLEQSQNQAREQRRFTNEGAALQNQFAELRRETMVVSRDPTQISVIDDDDENNNDDDDDFCPSFFSSRKSGWELPDSRPSSRNSDPVPGSNSMGSKWNSRLSLRALSFDLDETDDLDTGSDTPELIYYPPSEADSTDTYPGSYQVFNSDLPLTRQKRLSRRFGMLETNIDEADSESTDPISLDDDDNENDDTLPTSQPSTPSDPDREFLARTPDKEKFVQDNFETINFTPIATDKFNKALDSLEQEMNTDARLGPHPFSPRLSISHRFLSRAQGNIKNMGGFGGFQRQENWFDPLQKSKTEMARAVDETRKQLSSMGWRTNTGEGPEKDRSSPPSPPTKLESPKPHFPTTEESKLSIPKPSISPNGSPWERQSAASPVDNIPKSPSKLSSRSSGSLSPKLKDRSRKSYTLRSASSTGKLTELDNKTSKPSGKTASYLRPTRSSNAKISRASSSSSLPLSDDGSQSSGSSSSMSKSSSLQNLNQDQPLSPKKKSSRNGRSLSKSAFYASTPNLAVCMEEDEEEDIPVPVTNLKGLVDLSKSVPDINDIDDFSSSAESTTSSSDRGAKEPLSGVRRLKDSLSRKHGEVNRINRRSMPAGSLQPDNISPGGTRRSVSPFDKHLMPPPQSGTLGRPKHDTFLKRAQAKRRVTSDMTLDRAKDILLGKSGILKSSMENLSVEGSGRKVNLSGSSGQPHSRSSSSASSSVFDSELGHASASTLAAVEDIEKTANEIRRQKAASASPNDLPERDTTKPSRTKSPMPSSRRFSGADLSGKIDGVSQRTRSQSVDDLDSTLTESSDAEHLLPSVKARVAQYMSLNRSSDDLGASPKLKTSVNVSLSPHSSRSSATSPAPSGRDSSTDLKQSPRSDTGFGSDTDTDQEIKRPDKSTSHPRLCLVNGVPTITNSVSLTTPVSSSQGQVVSPVSVDHTSSPSTGVRDKLTLPLNIKPAEYIEQHVMNLVIDVKEILQRSREVYKKCQDAGASQSMSVLQEVFGDGARTFSDLSNSVSQDSASKTDQSKDSKSDLVEQDELVAKRVAAILNPAVNELGKQLKNRLFDEMIRDVVSHSGKH